MEDTNHSLYEIYDSLNPYEVAVLVFTSPAGIADSDESRQPVVVTTKESYLWAGAVAHALVRDPNLDPERIGRALDQAVLHYYEDRHRYRDIVNPSYRRHYSDGQADAVEYFLRLLNVNDRDLVYQRTEAAVRSLVWRGYIEDPFNKKIGAIVTAVVLVMPIGFTSPGPGNVRLDALTWQYVESTENNVRSRQLRVKVKEASEVVLNMIVPAAVAAIDKLSGASDGQGMRDRDVQVKLAQLGYYKGAIDDKIGPRTIDAIRRFQRDNYLEVTGYLDPMTLQRLKSA